MTPRIQVGTILIEDHPLVTRILDLERESYSGNWSVVKAIDGFALDRKIHAAGWNFFFMAEEVKATVFGSLAAKSIQKALKRICLKVRKQNFNCLEVTGIVAKRASARRRFKKSQPFRRPSLRSRRISEGREGGWPDWSPVLAQRAVEDSPRWTRAVGDQSAPIPER